MPSAQKLMHDFTGATERAEKRLNIPQVAPPVAEDAASQQARIMWMQSSITQDMVKSLKAEENDLINISIELSMNYPASQNHLRIIQNLVRVNQIRTIINKYATIS